jgi:hypothetical protein
MYPLCAGPPNLVRDLHHPPPATFAAVVNRPVTQCYHPQAVFARLTSLAWEGACDARTAGVPTSSIEGELGDVGDRRLSR